MPEHSNIVVVGSLNADFVIRVPRFPTPGETLVGQDFKVFPGGKGANQAYAAARLGGAVLMLGQVGNDAHAEWLRSNLARVGVDVSGIQTDPRVASGIATITIDAQGQNEIIIVPGSNGTFTPDRLRAHEAALARAGYLLLQFEIPMVTIEAVARLAKAAGAMVVVDPAPAQPISDELLALADYVTPNETELALLTATRPATLGRPEATALARRLIQRGARKVLVKMGSQGALLVAALEELFWPAIPVKVADTTAAGDAFNGAFVTALAGGSSEFEAGRFAAAAAAWSVSRPGAQPSMPTMDDVRALLR